MKIFENQLKTSETTTRLRLISILTTDSEQALALDLVLVMETATTTGVMGLVRLGSILEYVKIVMIEILIKVLIVVVTIAGNVKVMLEILIQK